jgi:hypothetical protein
MSAEPTNSFDALMDFVRREAVEQAKKEISRILTRIEKVLLHTAYGF